MDDYALMIFSIHMLDVYLFYNIFAMVSFFKDFVQNLFELFDIENRGYISIQELIGGLRLLMV